MTPDTDSSSIINHTSSPQNDQRRQIIHHLVLLLHAHKCLQRERQASNNGDNHETTSQNLCTVPHCATMRTVLQHMIKCGDFKNCSCKFNNYIRINENTFFYLLLSYQLCSISSYNSSLEKLYHNELFSMWFIKKSCCISITKSLK